MTNLNGYYCISSKVDFMKLSDTLFLCPRLLYTVCVCMREREQNVCAKENYRGRDLLALSLSPSSSFSPFPVFVTLCIKILFRLKKKEEEGIHMLVILLSAAVVWETHV